jgi:hypothetical protein
MQPQPFQIISQGMKAKASQKDDEENDQAYFVFPVMQVEFRFIQPVKPNQVNDPGDHPTD